MTTGKTLALTRWTFVGQVMSLIFNMLSRLREGAFQMGTATQVCKMMIFQFGYFFYTFIFSWKISNLSATGTLT